MIEQLTDAIEQHVLTFGTDPKAVVLGADAWRGLAFIPAGASEFEFSLCSEAVGRYIHTRLMRDIVAPPDFLFVVNKDPRYLPSIQDGPFGWTIRPSELLPPTPKPLGPDWKALWSDFPDLPPLPQPVPPPRPLSGEFYELPSPAAETFREAVRRYMGDVKAPPPAPPPPPPVCAPSCGPADPCRKTKACAERDAQEQVFTRRTRRHDELWAQQAPDTSRPVCGPPAPMLSGLGGIACRMVGRRR